MSFTKLQGVSLARLDEAIDGFTDQDWDDLERGYLDPIALDVADHLTPLGVDAEADSIDLLCRLYKRSHARSLEDRP